MSITAQDVVRQVRQDLSDEIEPYRWDDTRLLRDLTRGRNEIVRQRPDALYTGTAIVTTPVDELPDVTALTGTGSDTRISKMFLNALVHYIDYAVLLGDSEDASNQKLAEFHWNQFVKEIA